MPNLLMEIRDSWFYIVAFLSCAIYIWFNRRKLKLPPGPVCLPIVGYLPYLGKEPFKTLNDLGKIHGNIFSLYLGRKFVVILNDIDAIQNAFQSYATLFRPPGFFSFLPDAVGFASSNGSEWVEQRRFTFRNLKRLFAKSKWERLVKEEIEDLLQVLDSRAGQVVDVCSLLSSYTTSNIWSLMYGKRLPTSHPTRKAISYYVGVVPRFFATGGLQMIFPALSKLFAKLKIFGYGKIYRDIIAFHDIVRGEIFKCKTKIDNDDEDSYVDEYYKEMKIFSDNNVKTTFSENLLTGNVQAMFIGGSETTKTSLHWLLLAIAAFPEKQKKVHQELDIVLDEGKIPSWKQRNELPYTFAAVMEGQRWKTVVPLSLTRVAAEDIKIGGFDIPKGTLIFPNLWSAHNDERYWKEPDKFCPERFLEESENKFISRSLSYAPFSIGRRSCPAETVAYMEIFFYFTAIMLKFELFPPIENEPLNLEAFTGVTYSPLEKRLRFVPRH